MPKTELGKKVMSGAVASIDEIFKNGWKIKEPAIVDRLLPNLRSEIIFFGGSPGKGGGIKRTPTRRTARMHRSGRRYNISAFVVVGAPGYAGLGKSTSKEHALAIDKATNAAKLNIIPIKRACGSWECMCGTAHSIPISVIGKSGSVTIELKPAPKGLGLAIGDEAKKMLAIAGVKDVWSKARGKTQSRFNYMMAVLDAFKAINRLRGELKEGKTLKEEEAAPPPEKKPAEEIPEEIKDVVAVPEEDSAAGTSAGPEMKVNQEAEGVEEKEQ
jgi:small subunit ribosomal protein S5